MSCWPDAALLIAATLMSWADEPTIIDRFQGTRGVVGTVLPRGVEPGATYQGFGKAMLSRGEALLEQARVHLRRHTRDLAGRWLKRMGFFAVAADGSRVLCPRTIANEEAFGLFGKDAASPQMNLVCLWHMGLGLNWDWRISDSRTGERSLLLEMLGDLPEEALVVADAGFTGFNLLDTIHQSGRFFLVRVGSNVELLKELGEYRREGHDTVYLWPEMHREHRPLVLRLIRLGSVWLITNVLDRKRLSEARALKFYRLRWGVEVGFRTLKQTLNRRKMRCAAPRQARMELNWTMVGLTLLGLMSVTGIKRRRVDPLEWSPAAALRVIRLWRRKPCVSPRDAASAKDQLLGLLARCVKDRYKRKHGKNSYNWPHKKNPSPPGAPTLTTASKAVKAQAAQLRAAA